MGETSATPEILEWIAKTHVSEDEGSSRAFAAPEVHGIPAIQLGPTEAKALGLFVRMTGASKVVEIGALAGYSAIHLAKALPRDGHLYSLEIEPRHARLAEEHLAASGLSSLVTVIVGPAAETLPAIEAHGPFDIVFIDADKVSYPRYGRWAARNLRAGGLLVAENAFLFGQLLLDTPEAQAMRRFHTEATQAFVTTCLPTPEGMLLGVRK